MLDSSCQTFKRHISIWEFKIESCTCFLPLSFLHILFISHFVEVVLPGGLRVTRLLVPDHLSGTLSGCAAWLQGQTGCASASSRYLVCWHPRRILHGLTHPRSARNERQRESKRSDFDQYQSRLLCPNTD